MFEPNTLGQARSCGLVPCPGCGLVEGTAGILLALKLTHSAQPPSHPLGLTYLKSVMLNRFSASILLLQ